MVHSLLCDLHTINYISIFAIWGCSSVGRAPALQAGGQEFESPHLHQTGSKNRKNPKNKIFSNNITGQATKGTGRMPWHREPKKDATSSESLGKKQIFKEPGVSEWGNPLKQTLSIIY